MLAGLVASQAYAPAYAQAARTFVSSSGNDANPCSRQAPCRSFAIAITKTAAGGEINTLDPGGYGAFEITKAISIVSGLGEAGVLVPEGGTGILVNAGANDAINLRGLAIEGAGLGLQGIRFNTGGSLTITNSVIRNMSGGTGIDFRPQAESYLTISDTLVADNGSLGIHIFPQTSGTANAYLNRVIASRHQWGFFVDGSVSGTAGPSAVIVDSAAVNNTTGLGIGVSAEQAKVVIRHSDMTGNKVGLNGRSGNVELAQSTIAQNGTGIKCVQSILQSYHDNIVFRNNVDGEGCLTGNTFR